MRVDGVELGPEDGVELGPEGRGGVALGEATARREIAFVVEGPWRSTTTRQAAWPRDKFVANKMRQHPL